MTLARRIIPCLDVKGGRVVKGINFVGLRDAGDPVERARRYTRDGADEITFLDISATHEGRKTLFDVVERTAAECMVPLTVGGGVRSVSDVRDLLLAGADKVSINSAALKDPGLITRIAERFGRQVLVVAIDAKKSDKGDGYMTFTHGGRKPAGKDPVKWAAEAADLGAGEILLTCMDRDGTQNGYDLELTARVASRVSIPVVASGGVGELSHVFDGLTKGGADAALAASIFHDGRYTVSAVKRYLLERGVPIRPPRPDEGAASRE